MKKYFPLIVSFFVTISLSACGNQSISDTNEKLSNADMEVDTYRELPSCVSKRNGKTAFVVDQEQGYVCRDGKWVEEDDVVNVDESSCVIKEKYDCEKYNCVSTQYLNQKMLADGKYGELLDNRDNQVYRTIKIGDQIWMAQNLNYKTEGSICYDEKEENCKIHGRLYDGYSLESCPEGWHVPSEKEFIDLMSFIEEKEIIREDNKQSDGLWIWYTNTNKTASLLGSSNYEWKAEEDYENSDAYGFSLISSGIRWDYGAFTGLEESARLWTTSTKGSRNVVLSISMNEIAVAHYDLLNYEFPIRCLKDNVNPTKTSSSSVETKKENNSKSSSSASQISSYNCKKYDCVTTKYLNQEMLAEGKYGELLDERDNRVYRTVKIGDQIWMAQNLNYKTEGSACYDEKEDNCEIYGRLYDGSSLESCPEGWHVPSEKEFIDLMSYVEGVQIDKDENRQGDGLWIEYGNTEKTVSVLKSANYNWDSDETNDSYGFSLLPSGQRWDYGAFDGLNKASRLWTVSKKGSRNIVFQIHVDDDIVKSHYDLLDYEFSIRCLKN